MHFNVNSINVNNVHFLRQTIVNVKKSYFSVIFTSGQYPHVWFGVIITFVVTKNAPFSAGGIT